MNDWEDATHHQGKSAREVTELVAKMASNFHMERPLESMSTSGSPGATNMLKSRLFKKGTQPMTSVEAKINAYAFLEQADGDLDILAFWRSRSTEFPTLAKMARNVLAIQATSAPSERVFSSGRRVLRWDRTRMSPETLEMLVLIKDWYKEFGIVPHNSINKSRRSTIIYKLQHQTTASRSIVLEPAASGTGTGLGNTRTRPHG
ncbi:MAG: ribonuclease H-like domain-containing protein [Olpidium bornovanus]|uniref:Ribonuclease H-like domain-containing protein n=1 Tax=Olpidium bornovanus TaxID=278681 RepID=A0A8H8DLJ8_9FUNG|nr:MAG: ribonuclease H-like domain-containing protein [Olpidium bornovanus]